MFNRNMFLENQHAAHRVHHRRRACKIELGLGEFSFQLSAYAFMHKAASLNLSTFVDGCG